MPVITGNISYDELLNVISKKIYDNNQAKTVSFVLSLLIHSSLVATIFYFAPQKVIRPVQTQDEKVITVSLYTPSKSTTKTESKPIHKQTPKKQLPKKQISKKAVPLKQKTKPIIKEKSLQKSPTTPKEVVSSSEVITPVAPVKEPIVSNDIQDLNSPKSMKNSPHLEQEISPHVLGQIRSMIQNSLIYPSIARKMKLEGVVVISFVLTQDGRVENAIIHTKSGSHSLDAKALKTVVALSGEYPHLDKKVDLQIPISFSLKNS